MELAYENTDRAVQLARRVLARKPSYDSRLRAALALAAAGSGREAEDIANELATGNPEHTLINAVLVPIVRAGIELSRNQPVRAIEHLQVVAPYELGFIAALTPVYLRGRAYLLLGLGLQAAEAFQRILDHRGSDPFSPFHAVASLGLARGCRMAGNVAGSLRAYERFLAGWSDADPDVPELFRARDEYEGLKGGATSPNARVGPQR